MKRIGNLQSLVGGISQSKKSGAPYTFSFGRSIDFRRDSSEITIQPLTSKISGSTVVDLPMWMDVAGNYMYAYGNVGNVYQITTADVVTNEYTVADSVGNGMGYLAEDRFLYLASNTSLSRKSTANAASGTYYANFLESEGGAPTNTRSIDFEASSSMSATRADTASLSITGDITLEAFLKPESMPTGSNTMAIMGKWDESGTLRSYKLAFVPTSNALGNGVDGALTISANTTQSLTDSACTGTSGSTALSATNASFTAGQKVLIHQTRGTNAGQKQVNSIASYTAGTITLDTALNATYTSGAQVIVVPQYTTVTVNSGVTWTGKSWNGTVGGLLLFTATGAITVNGTISVAGTTGATTGVTNNAQTAQTTGGGFYGGYGHTTTQTTPKQAQTGEGTAGAPALQRTANGSGGGGGNNNTGGGAGGGGGGHATNGTDGGASFPGAGGLASGSADLASFTFGGGGGGGTRYSASGNSISGAGGSGGGIVFMTGATLEVTGVITANGGDGGLGRSGGNYGGGGGGGAAGSISIRVQSAILGTGLITAVGGAGGTSGGATCDGGAGANGRINIDYFTSFTGTTTPTTNSVSDPTLGETNGHAVRFYVSSTGLNAETYTQNIDDPTNQWNRFSVAWDASASTAYFYLNGSLVGTKTGALTAIHDNASAFQVGTFENSGGSLTDFYDGLMDDIRVWNDLRSASEIANYNREVLTGSEGGLVAYYKCDSAVTDSQTAGNNDLTANNSPTYSTDIPFSGVTTRSDQDVAIAGSGQTYALTTALNEGATHRQTFTPTKEPLKSLALNINAVSTGNVTVVVHDELNRELASVTVAAADLIAGVYEFRFATAARPVLNAEYHLHIYSTVADGSIVSGVASDLEGAYLRTYYQILVSDTYHPIKQFTNFLVVGNERYVGKLEAGSVYNPHRLTLPSGYRVRCFGFWHDYLAIGTWQGDDITDVDSAKILLWDGTSETYVEPIDVPQGAINALFGKQGRLFISAGYRGQFFEYSGGPEASPLFRLPLSEKSDEIEIAPGAVTMWEGILQVGATLSTDSTTLHQGVYTWGRDEMTDPVSLGFDYPLSIGDQMSSNVMIGSLLARGKKLYVGFANAGSYGIDVVDKSANAAATATIELLNTDLLSVVDLKYPLTFRVDFLPLVSGQSVVLKYKADREASWRILATQSTAGASEVAGSILKAVKEIQFAVDITTNGSQVTIINFAFDAQDVGSKSMRYVR